MADKEAKEDKKDTAAPEVPVEKPKYPPAPPPETERLEKEQADEEAKIIANKEKVAEIKKKIEDIYTSIAKKEEQRSQISEQLDHAKANVDVVLHERSQLVGKLQASREKLNEFRNKSREMERSLGKLRDQASIDEAIAAKNFSLQTESLTLKQEKAVLADIKKLDAIRPEAEALAKMQADNAEDKLAMDAVRAELDKLNKKADEARAKRLEFQSQIGPILDAKRASYKDIDGLKAQAATCHQEITRSIELKHKLGDELFHQKQAYENYKWQQTQEKRKAERAKRQAEWEERKKQREEEEKFQAQFHPNHYQIETVKNCIDYLERKWAEHQKSLGNDGGAAAAPAVAAQAKAEPGKKKLLGKKAQNDEADFWGTGLSGGKSKGKGKGKGRKKKIVPLSIDPAMMATFAEIKVSPPFAWDKVDACLKALAVRVKFYEENVPKKGGKKEKGEKKEKKEEKVKEEEKKEEKKEENKEKEEESVAEEQKVEAEEPEKEKEKDEKPVESEAAAPAVEPVAAAEAEPAVAVAAES